LRTCIACGLRRVERRVVDVELRSGKIAHDVEADVCANCGERYFDMDAMDKIEAVMYPETNTRRRAIASR
jgi:YgiT-type zinc finger domain-containing protein